MENLISLVVRAQRGHADAREELVRRFQDMAVGYAYSILGDFHAAEDASQEAFVAALGDLGSLRTPQAFPAWFRRVVYKHCDRMRRKQRESIASPKSLPEIESPDLGPAAHFEQHQREHWLTTAVRSLPEEERIVTSLFYMGEYTHQQISDFLEMPLATVNNRLRSARRQLEKEIIEMAKNTMRAKAPSRDDNFLNLVGLRTAINVGDVARVRTLVDERPDLLRQHHGGLRPLNDAALAGRPEIVHILLDAGADPTYDHYVPRPEEQARERGYEEVVRVFERFSQRRLGVDPKATALCRAIRDGDDDGVRASIDGAPLDRTDEDGRAPLHRAIEVGRQNLVGELLDRGASVDFETPLAPRPLLLALDRPDPNLPMARLLIEHGAKYDLFAACCLGDLDTVQRLVSESGYPTPAPVAPRPVHFVAPPPYPIVGAVRGGHVEIIHFLVENAEGPAVEVFGEEALSIAGMWAARTDAIEILRLLLAAGLHPDGPTRHLGADDEPITKLGEPLLFAAENGYTDICRLLIEHGATPDHKIDSTTTAVQRAYRNGHREIVELLESHGAMAPVETLALYAGPDSLERIAERLQTIVDTEGGLPFQGPNSMLSHCAETGRADVVKLILDHRPEIDDYNPLNAACSLGTPTSDQVAVVRLLLEYGADPRAVSPTTSSYGHGMTVLHHLARGSMRGCDCRTEVADLLLEYGADIEARDDDRRATPLCWAAAEGDHEMVEFLLKRGASVEGSDSESGLTPLAWARQKGHDEIAELLVARGTTE
ncbi:MAG: sigma-70 family RNA polymerase sigma factor [Candidatus Latescibacteria bacterium]|nr:sigma-70 family RNA polymerase sigma factor [Candidatus Latescibacterota bacterium]